MDVEWSRAEVNEDCDKEVMWVQVQGDRESVAQGVNNDQIEQDLAMDATQLKKKGMAVVLIGDANRHIG